MAALCIAAVLAATASGTSAGAAATVYRPAAGFADVEYSVPFYGQVWSDNARPDSPKAVATNSVEYFAEIATVERDGSSLDLSFAVEDQSGTPFRQACDLGDGCHDVTVQASTAGMLYLNLPPGSEELQLRNVHLGGFPSRAVELSATDADSGLKVYREVTVGPSPAAADCGDYGDSTPEAFTCLFSRELLPAGQAADADVATLRAKLPPLVQDSANYRLVFAEEFNGEPSAADANGCRDGLSTLDDTIWNYFNACDSVDSKGEPCSNVGDGGFTMGVAGPCGFGRYPNVLLDTRSHLHMKYGYIEAQYTFNIDQWRDAYHNYNMILNLNGSGLRYLQGRYGVEIDDWEDFLKHSQVELDIFELPRSQHVEIQYDIAHQYANWGGEAIPDVLRPIRTVKWTQYCESSIYPARQGVVNNPRTCKNKHKFTVTKGIEWTPRGYRTYIKVHGLQSDLTLLPKDQITVQQKFDCSTECRTITQWHPRHKDRFFEYLVPGDNSTLLEQVGVVHIPQPLFLNVWSYMTRDGSQPYIRRRMTFDYVRVWQPENHYADMEPVYQ